MVSSGDVAALLTLWTPPHFVLPQDVLLHYGAVKYGSGPVALGQRSPRQSYNPAAPDFLRERGSYQNALEHP